MIKAILFDCDGVIVKRDKYFSQRMKINFGIELNDTPEPSFFKNEFIDCELGKKDLKVELEKQIPKWGINWTVDQVLKYWFEGERELDERMVKKIEELRSQGVKCYLSTNNEKYRTEYLRDAAGLGKILDGIFSCCYLGCMKPDIKFWAEIHKALPEINKAEVLAIDNKKEMADSAAAFGFHAEFFSTYENFIEQLKKYNL